MSRTAARRSLLLCRLRKHFSRPLDHRRLKLLNHCGNLRIEKTFSTIAAADIAGVPENAVARALRDCCREEETQSHLQAISNSSASRSISSLSLAFELTNFMFTRGGTAKSTSR